MSPVRALDTLVARSAFPGAKNAEVESAKINAARIAIGGIMIYRTADSGERELVPLNGVDGERLSYHRSDLLYFGNSLPWRRRMIRNDAVSYNEPGATGFQQIQEVCEYDFARSRSTTPITYQVTLYENRSARVNLPAPERYTAHAGYEFVITVPSNAVIEDRPAELARAR